MYILQMEAYNILALKHHTHTYVQYACAVWLLWKHLTGVNVSLKPNIWPFFCKRPPLDPQLELSFLFKRIFLDFLIIKQKQATITVIF